MRKDEMRQWLTDRLVTQSRLLMGAMAGMVVIGLIATLMELILFAAILRLGFVGSWGSAVFVTLLIQGAVQALTVFQLPKYLSDSEHEAELDGAAFVIRVVPNMTAVWTYAFGSLETDQSWQERLIGILSMPQRMCAAAWFTWKRLQELKVVSVEPCAAVIRLLHKEGEGVEVGKIADELDLVDLPTTIRHVSLIDGVFFLTRRSLGLSLATRLVDDIVDWKKKKKIAEQPDE